MRKVYTLVLLIICFQFTYSQNVGIGITNPGEKLQVAGGNLKIGNLLWGSVADNIYLKFGDAEFCAIGEVGGDDIMELRAKKFTFVRSNGNLSPFIEMNGAIKIVDGTEGANKILTSDASGNASWQSPIAVSYNAYVGNTSQNVASGTATKVSMGTESWDDGSNFSASTFVAPATGVYHFDATVYWSTYTANCNQSILSFRVLSAADAILNEFWTETSIALGASPVQSISETIKLNAGEKVAVYIQQNSGVIQNISGNLGGVSKKTRFSGYRIY